MAGAAVVAGCEAAEVLELVEASLDAVADLVDEPDRGGSAACGGLEGMTASAPMSAMSCEEHWNVIGLVGNARARRESLPAEAGARVTSPALAGREDEAQRSAAAHRRAMWILVVSPPRERPRA